MRVIQSHLPNPTSSSKRLNNEERRAATTPACFVNILCFRRVIQKESSLVNSAFCLNLFSSSATTWLFLSHNLLSLPRFLLSTWFDTTGTLSSSHSTATEYYYCCLAASSSPLFPLQSRFLSSPSPPPSLSLFVQLQLGIEEKEIINQNRSNVRKNKNEN